MKRKRYVPYLISIGIALGAGLLGSVATYSGMPDYERLLKPPLTPPSLAFPIVWTLLYVLMGVSAALIWKSHSPRRGPALTLYAVQLLFNSLWSILFFGLQWHCFAFFWLLALCLLVAAMVVRFSRIDPVAGLLQVPYLIWILFAAYLNGGIWLLNRP